MKVNNRTISYIVLLLCTVLFYISFNKSSMGSTCLLLSAFLVFLHLNNKTMVEILPSLLMAIVALGMLILSGRTGERGFNAPIANALKFVFLLFAQCAAVAMRRLDAKQKRIIILTTIVTIFLSCLISIFYARQDRYAIRDYAQRGFTNVMSFDQIYAVPFAFALVLLYLFFSHKESLKKYVIPVVFLVVSIVLGVFSLLTTALLLLFFSAGMCVVYYYCRKSPREAIIGIVLLVLLFLLAILFRQQVSDWLYALTDKLNWIVRARVRSVIDTIFGTSHANWYTTERRAELADYSLTTFMAHPIFGVGYIGYGYGVIGCHQEWSDMLGVFGIVGSVAIVSILGYNARIAYKHAATKLDRDALLLSMLILVVLGFLNPCLSKESLFLVYVVAPNISVLFKNERDMLAEV